MRCGSRVENDFARIGPLIRRHVRRMLGLLTGSKCGRGTLLLLSLVVSFLLLLQKIGAFFPIMATSAALCVCVCVVPFGFAALCDDRITSRRGTHTLVQIGEPESRFRPFRPSTTLTACRPTMLPNYRPRRSGMNPWVEGGDLRIEDETSAPPYPFIDPQNP